MVSTVAGAGSRFRLCRRINAGVSVGSRLRESLYLFPVLKPAGKRMNWSMWVHKLPSRGRAVILCGIGFFVAAQLALNFAIERWRPEWSDPEYGYRFRNLKKQIKTDPFRPLLVVLGSSRIGNGFDADSLPPPSWTGK